MIFHLVGGGPDELLPDLIKYNQENVCWVGVDRGVQTLITNNIQPQIAFGDFDSIQTTELEQIEKDVNNIQKYKPEKDETDMELALNWALKQSPSIIRIFGATGGRLDHFFANVQLLLRPLYLDKNVEIELVDRTNIISIKKPGLYSIKRCLTKKYISFIPTIKNVKGLTLKGFKYPLTNRDVSLSSTLCISNELLHDSGTFSFEEGILIVVRSSD